MIKECAFCGEQWDARARKNKFCSKSCAYASMTKREAIDCECCGRRFMPKQVGGKFCSHSCAASFYNKSRKRSDKCFCGVSLKSGQRAFCKREHLYLYQNAFRINEWLTGQWDGSVESGLLSNTVRKHLLEMARNRCTRCDWGEPNPILGKPILSVDHVDGNWKNNKVDNLVVLCYNCHTLTPTFNGLNIGNGAGIRGSGTGRKRKL